MTYTPDPEFETDIEDLSPAEAHDRWEEVTNLQENELRALKESERNDVYLDRAEGNQGADNPPIPGGPLDDAIHLASTSGASTSARRPTKRSTFSGGRCRSSTMMRVRRCCQTRRRGCTKARSA